MKKILLFMMALMPFMVACEKEKENLEEEEQVTIKLDDTNLTDYGYFDGVLYYMVNSDSPCEVWITKVENTATIVEIPSRIKINGKNYSCTSIGHIAFSGCSGLTSITIPEGVTSIGHLAFSGCSGLTSITIPTSVTRIGGAVFSDCSNLLNITVEDGNSVYNSREKCNAIIETATKTLIAGCKNTVIPKNVTSIGQSAFSGCSGLTSISIPESVTSIGDYAFSGCSGLTSITIPESVTSIGQSAFFDCSGLTSITIPESVTSIGGGAFYGCSGLTSIIIPESVTSIGQSAFFGCSGLISVVCKRRTPPTCGNNVFTEKINPSNPVFVPYCQSVILYVPTGSKEAYQNSEPWNGFKEIIEEEL